MALVAALVLVTGAFAVGGYLLGHSSGRDLSAARAGGHARGVQVGTARGRRLGIHDGAVKGRSVGLARSYGPSYRRSYRAAFRARDLDPPDKIEVASR